MCLVFDWVGSIWWDNVQQGRTIKMETKNENMCRVLASKDRHPPRVKAPLVLVIHMCPTVKARENVGRLTKPAMRPRKFATHKKTHDFEYK